MLFRSVTANISTLNAATANALTMSVGTIYATTLGSWPASGVTAGLYGSAVNVSSITVDSYGRVTAASNVTISGGTSSQWANVGATPAIYVVANVAIGASSGPTANLQVTGNAVVTNSVTTTNLICSNINATYFSNISNLVTPTLTSKIGRAHV